MKIQFALLALALTLPSFAQAKDTCAFGENTGDLSEMLDQNGRDKIWYKGEQLSIHTKQRLQGLTAVEKKMILMSKGAEALSSRKQAEALEDFVQSEGYITYFTHNSNGREFAQVGSYPGDNEFGVILEIKSLSRGREYKILKVAALISDGDFEDCLVKKD